MEEVSSRRYADEMVSTSHKSARPKSAFRRRVAVDRDLDMTEGESFEASDDRELLGDIINVDEIAYDLLPDEFTKSTPNPRLSMSSTSHRHFSMDQLNAGVGNVIEAGSTSQRTQSASLYSKEDEGFINQQGVHDLFADILFADPADLDEDYDSIASGLDEDFLYSSSRSFELEDQEENEYQEEQLTSRILTTEQDQQGSKEPSVVSTATAEQQMMMQRLLKRTAFDAQTQQARMEMLQAKPRQFLLGYSELQKASGLRVLRRLVERQKSVEESDNVLVKELVASYPNSAKCHDAGGLLKNSKRKPPARLKPLLPRR